MNFNIFQKKDALMASKQIKIDSDLHKKVKKFVDDSSRYSSYKSFYEDAVRRRLDQENTEMETLKKEINQLKKELK